MKEKTAANVHRAFVEEAKAYQRLLMYARKADKEDLPQIAALFRAVAEAEGVHARRHFAQLEAVSDTQTNLERAFDSENMVKDNAYPAMIAQAQEEDEKTAALIFSQARDVEDGHAKLYKRALERLMADQEVAVTYYVCPVCGFIHENRPQDPCPVCGAAPDKFYQVA